MSRDTKNVDTLYIRHFKSYEILTLFNLYDKNVTSTSKD